LDVALTFGSLLKVSMGLNIGWEVCGEFGDLRSEFIVSQTRELRDRIFFERVQWNFAEIGRMVDFW
jgi:hypothetical protein